MEQAFLRDLSMAFAAARLLSSSSITRWRTYGWPNCTDKLRHFPGRCNAMNTRLRFFAVGLAALLSTQGICAVASYQLQINENDPECNRFLNAVKESRIADMSNDELCAAITLPVTAVLTDSRFKELDWTQDPTANVALVAKSTRRQFVSFQNPRIVCQVLFVSCGKRFPNLCGAQSKLLNC
jgi:hypothetical protein